MKILAPMVNAKNFIILCLMVLLGLFFYLWIAEYRSSVIKLNSFIVNFVHLELESVDEFGGGDDLEISIRGGAKTVWDQWVESEYYQSCISYICDNRFILEIDIVEEKIENSEARLSSLLNEKNGK